ncbi:MAG TPA: STAS domain-containing protein [Bryobacteraceae bacterium]|jgi:anti-anti-sigma regulatory factor
MLRLTTIIAEDGSLTIHIAGRLTLDGCNAIDEILKDTRKPLRPATIDLDGIRLVDRSCIDYLASMRRRQIRLINLPPYVNRWIEQASK